VKNARKLDEISYDEMLELASLGAKVMQSRSVEFAKKFKVIFSVRSSMNDNPGTLVKEETRKMEDVVVRGVSVDKNQAKVTIANVPDRPGVAARIFKAIADTHVNVDMIVQNVSESGLTDMTFTVNKDDLPRARKVIESLVREIGAKGFTCTEGMAKLSVVGIGMRSHSGVAAGMFEALAVEKINIQMISTSEIKISVVIDAAEADRAMKVVHEKFGLGKMN
jgi:aspartate kinase